MESVSVIINVYNEIETIEKEIRDIHHLIVSQIPDAELIVAEDGSRDGTSQLIQKLVKELGIIHSTSLVRKGYLKAFRDAVSLAKNEWIFFSDTGGKNDFSEFWRLYNAKDNADLIIGTRTGRKDQLYRRFLTWSYNRLLQLYFGVLVTDADSGFRLYKRSALKQVVQQEWINKELISSEIVIRMHNMHANIKEVPITYRKRQGVSRGLPLKKMPQVIFRVLRNLPKLKQAACTLQKITIK